MIYQKKKGKGKNNKEMACNNFLFLYVHMFDLYSNHCPLVHSEDFEVEVFFISGGMGENEEGNDTAFPPVPFKLTTCSGPFRGNLFTFFFLIPFPSYVSFFFLNNKVINCAKPL